MMKTILYLLVGVVIYSATNGPIINIFSGEAAFLFGIPSLYIWNIIMQLFAVGWVIYGLKSIPFIRGVKENS